MTDNNRTMINEETEGRKTERTEEGRTNSVTRASLAFASPESSVGLTPLPWPWWKYGVGETLPSGEEGGGTLRREGAAAATDGTAIDGGGGGWMCNSGAASEAARDRDLWCSRWRRLSTSSLSSLHLSDIF